MNWRKKIKTAFWLACAFLCFSRLSFAEVDQNKIPQDLKDIGIDEHRGENIDLNLTFQNEKNETVTLGQYFSANKPVVLALVYYGCPNICTFILNGVVDSLKKIDLKPGEKFNVVAVSIDPSEKPDLAAEKKQAYLDSFGYPETVAGWHFLTGKESNIKKLAQQIGYRYKWVEETKQFAHGSAIFILTPEGRISRYLYGIQYAPHDMKLALLEASSGKIGSFMDRIMLFCFYYDTATKKYVLLANKIMTASGALTLVFLALFLGRFWLKEKTTELKMAHRE